MLNYWVCPEPAVEPPEPRTVCFCSVCRQDIYEDEVYGMGPRGPVCSDCIESAWLDLSTAERCELLGLEPVREEVYR